MKLKNTYSVETVADQLVLLPSGQAVIDGGLVFHLNDTGAWALRELERDVDFETLLRRAEQHFEAENEEDRATLRTDFTDFLHALRRLDLLEE